MSLVRQMLIAVAMFPMAAQFCHGAEPDKYDLARRQCIEDAKKGSSFRSCGYDKAYGGWLVTWPRKSEWIEPDLNCPYAMTGPDSQRAFHNVVEGDAHLVLACTWPSTSDKKGARGWVAFAHPSLDHPARVDFSCSCTSLEADRLHFDKDKRIVSFNLKTDATSIKVDERELSLPMAKIDTSDRSVTMIVPIFRAELNER